MSSTPLTDAINALTTYANETTGASDTTLSDAVGTLVSGYGSGGGISTSTDFSAGNIQAIIGDGSSYIETDFTTPANGLYYVKFSCPSSINYEYIFCISISSSSRILLQRYRSSSTDYSSVVGSTNTTIVGAPNGSINIQTVNALSLSDTASLPLLIFRGYYNGAMESQTSKCTFYGLNILDSSGDVVARFMPWLDDNSVACVKELVSGNIYYNAGSGTFGYIDASGTTHSS